MTPKLAPPTSPRTILRDLMAFLRSPAVMTPEGLRSRTSWQALGVLVVVHIAGMLLVILPLISAWQRLFTLPSPDAFGKIPADWLVPITVAIAPVAEEIIFRGWQTGRPRALWLTAGFALIVVLGTQAPKLSPAIVATALGGLVIASIGGWLWLRKRRDAPAAYRKAYPAVFWLVAAGFAAAHFMNYPTVTAASVPMVLPQLWAALLLGFTRQRLGLPASTLQHVLANGSVIILAALS